MGKIKRKAPGHGPIAPKVIRELSYQANHTVLDLQSAAELEKSIISEKEIAGYPDVRVSLARILEKQVGMLRVKGP